MRSGHPTVPTPNLHAADISLGHLCGIYATAQRSVTVRLQVEYYFLLICICSYSSSQQLLPYMQAVVKWQLLCRGSRKPYHIGSFLLTFLKQMPTLLSVRYLVLLFHSLVKRNLNALHAGESHMQAYLTFFSFSFAQYKVKLAQ